MVSCLIFVSAFAANICPKCHYENADGERYCVNCAEEIKPISDEEKERLEQINKKRFLKAEEIRKKEAEKQIESADTPPASTSKTKSKILIICANGKNVNLEGHAVRGAVTIFDFHADWCGPCQTLKQDLEPFVLGTKNVYLKKINIVHWKSPVALRYQIHSVPSVWIFDKNAILVRKNLNAIEEIQKAVSELL